MNGPTDRGPGRKVALGVALVVAVAAAGSLAALGVDRLGARHGAAGGGRAAGPPPAPPVRLKMTPPGGAHGVALDAHARVTAVDGSLRAVRAGASGGRVLAGSLAADRRSWTSRGPLDPATSYRVAVDAVNRDGVATHRVLGFTTLTPRAELHASVMPLAGETVGVGLPLAVWFNRPVGDRAAVERRLQVTASRPVHGAWHWFNDREVHYRPKGYWPSGARVTLDAHLAGLDLGDGVWGVADRHVPFRVGERHVSVVSVAHHTMTVTAGGKTLRVLPVSTGRDKYPTTNGVHFVIEKHQDELMDSATVGIPRNSPDGYYEHVYWSVRISNSGEFVHAAPWSVGSQGRANVSHGCVNLSTADATWFFGLARRGDVVQVVGSPKPPGSSFGVADWNMSWSAWLAGSALQGH